MPSARDPGRNHIRLSSLVAFALNEGWQVSRTDGGRLVFSRRGLPPIFTGFPCDRDGNTQAQRPPDAEASRSYRGRGNG